LGFVYFHSSFSVRPLKKKQLGKRDNIFFVTAVVLLCYITVKIIKSCFAMLVYDKSHK